MLKTLQKQQDTNAWKTNKTFLILFQVWGNWTCRNSTTPFHGWFEASSLTMSSFLDVSTHSPHSLCHYVIFGYRSSSPSLSSSSSSQSSLFSVSRLTWTHIIIVIPILIVILIIIIIILTIIIILIIFRSQVDVDAALVEAERVGRACSRQFPSCSVSRIDILRQLYDLDVVVVSFISFGWCYCSRYCCCGCCYCCCFFTLVVIVVSLLLRVKDRHSQAIIWYWCCFLFSFSWCCCSRYCYCCSYCCFPLAPCQGSKFSGNPRILSTWNWYFLCRRVYKDQKDTFCNMPMPYGL